MKELMIALMFWISAQTGYQVKVEPPAVYFMTPQEVADICVDEGTLVPYMAEACYKLHKHAIYLRNNFDIKNPERVGVLVHELTHVLQLSNGRVYNMRTMNYLEGQAEKIEAIYESSTDIQTRIARQFGQVRLAAGPNQAPEVAAANTIWPTVNDLPVAAKEEKSYDHVFEMIKQDIVDPAGMAESRKTGNSMGEIPGPQPQVPDNVQPVVQSASFNQSNPAPLPDENQVLPADSEMLINSIREIPGPRPQLPNSVLPVVQSASLNRSNPTPVPAEGFEGRRPRIGNIVGGGLTAPFPPPVQAATASLRPAPGPNRCYEAGDLIGLWQGYRLQDLFADNWPDYWLDLDYRPEGDLSGAMFVYQDNYIIKIVFNGSWEMACDRIRMDNVALDRISVKVDDQAGLSPREHRSAAENIPVVEEKIRHQTAKSPALFVEDAEKIVLLASGKLITRDDQDKVFVYHRK